MIQNLRVTDSPVWERFFTLGNEQQRHGFEIMLVYANVTAQKIKKPYLPVAKHHTPRHHANWSSFIQAAEQCDKLNADYEIYIKAQYDQLPLFERIFPNQLSGLGAVNRYEKYKKELGIPAHVIVKQQRYDYGYYEEMFKQIKDRHIANGRNISDKEIIEVGVSSGLFPKQYAEDKLNG